ncbi:MAG: alpha/beta hydrolase [Verrucomicrobia bacterium]|nr:alpha/beta hydrolase [Verrucomicrobiota bacterium]
MKKAPLVLVSGLLSSDTLWEHQVRHLRDVTSSIQVVSPIQNTPELMVQEILGKAPPVFALAGHSMGGWLCLEIMRTAPSRVSKLCLVNTTARDDSKEKKENRQKMILQAKEGRFSNVVKELVGKLVLNAAVKKDVEKMFLEVGKEALISQEEAMLMRKETLPILPGIACPTLVIHAAQDKNFSFEEHEELVERIPHAKLAIVEDSGHMSPLEMPQAITALLRCWLTWL